VQLVLTKKLVTLVQLTLADWLSNSPDTLT